MSEFTKEIEGIYRLRVPFDTVYTSVFLITADKNIMVDCATTKTDVEDYIIPALAALGYAPTDIDVLVLTHNHGDHAGGREYFLAHSPATRVVTELTEICDKVSTYPMAGHTGDHIGVFDERTGTLITGDGIQGAGVDKYRTSIKDRSEYIKTLERVKNDTRVENLLFSHAYEPWYCDMAAGRSRVIECLRDSYKFIGE
jgi:glyoxylase-like metal-dependent hydrolase (beta-lactamase superfamily II)